MQDIFQSWPLAAVFCFIIFMVLFRAPISDLLGRIQRVSHKGSGIELADQPKTVAQQQKTAEVPAAQPIGIPGTSTLTLPPAAEPVCKLERQIESDLKAVSRPDMERAVLIRALAMARILAGHEQVYRLILGSQITLLLESNTAAHPSLEKARAIYDDARARFPVIYANFAFEAWLNYPLSMNLIEWQTMGSNQLLHLTALGRDFLQYLLNVGLTSPKAG